MSDLRDDVARVLGAYPTPGMWSDEMTKRIRQQAFGEADAILAIPAIASALAGRDAVIDALDAAMKQLVAMGTAGCTCHTKSPVVQYHLANCTYRQVAECLENVEDAIRALNAAPAPGDYAVDLILAKPPELVRVELDNSHASPTLTAAPAPGEEQGDG